jgi:3-phenylpropionate/trans-cinnamate dioxygenase ferredoxin subunit
VKIDLGPLEGFPEGQAVTRDANGCAIVAVRIDAVVYALKNECSHEDYPLDDGEVDVTNCEIECSRHGALFSLKSGEPHSLPATKPVATFPTVIEDDHVYVEMP